MAPLSSRTLWWLGFPTQGDILGLFIRLLATTTGGDRQEFREF
ncbi:MAG: hypothetical protein VKK80_11455 [Prochlorothrix sp.]|nr:hypothetical protein [Prochlorothrix sp.]